MNNSKDVTIVYDNAEKSSFTNFDSVVKRFNELYPVNTNKSDDVNNELDDTPQKRAVLYLKFCNYIKDENNKNNFPMCNPIIIYNMIKRYYLDASDKEREEVLSPEYMLNAIRLGEEKIRGKRAEIYKRYCDHLESIKSKSSFSEVYYKEVESWINLYWTRQFDIKKDIRFDPELLQRALSKALLKLEEYGVAGIIKYTKAGEIDFNFWKMHIVHYSEAIEKGDFGWYTDKHKVETNHNTHEIKDRLSKLDIKDLLEIEEKLNKVALEDNSENLDNE